MGEVFEMQRRFGNVGRGEIYRKVFVLWVDAKSGICQDWCVSSDGKAVRPHLNRLGCAYSSHYCSTAANPTAHYTETAPRPRQTKSESENENDEKTESEMRKIGLKERRTRRKESGEGRAVEARVKSWAIAWRRRPSSLRKDGRPV